jgi:hypothetical protein
MTDNHNKLVEEAIRLAALTNQQVDLVLAEAEALNIDLEKALEQAIIRKLRADFAERRAARPQARIINVDWLSGQIVSGEVIPFPEGSQS